MIGKWLGKTSRYFCYVGSIGACVAIGADVMVKPIKIDSHSVIENLSAISKEDLAYNSSIPVAGGRITFVNKDKSVEVGVWESSAGILKLDTHSVEYIHVVAGTAVIHDMSGNSWTYKKGDSFVLPSGFKGTAEIVGHFKKEFVQIK